MMNRLWPTPAPAPVGPAPLGRLSPLSGCTTLPREPRRADALAG